MKSSVIKYSENKTFPKLMVFRYQSWRVVEPPYLLDFGKVYVNQPPPYKLHEMPNWHEKIREEFEGNSAKVYAVLSALRQLGIHYVDPRPGNINFGDEE